MSHKNPFAALASDDEEDQAAPVAAAAQPVAAAQPAKKRVAKPAAAASRGRGRGGASAGASAVAAGDPDFRHDDRGAENRAHRRGRGAGKGPRTGYDRHSRTAHNETEKRHGAGAGNWGTEAPSTTVDAPIGALDINDPIADVDEETGEPIEPEPVTMTLDDYMKEQETGVLAAEVKRKPNQGVDNAQWKNTRVLDTKPDTDEFVRKGPKKRTQQEKQFIELDFSFRSRDDEERGGFRGRGRGRGRGEGRGGRGRGEGRGEGRGGRGRGEGRGEGRGGRGRGEGRGGRGRGEGRGGRGAPRGGAPRGAPRASAGARLTQEDFPALS